MLEPLKKLRKNTTMPSLFNEFCWRPKFFIEKITYSLKSSSRIGHNTKIKQIRWKSQWQQSRFSLTSFFPYSIQFTWVPQQLNNKRVFDQNIEKYSWMTIILLNTNYLFSCKSKITLTNDLCCDLTSLSS